MKLRDLLEQNNHIKYSSAYLRGKNDAENWHRTGDKKVATCPYTDRDEINAWRCGWEHGYNQHINFVGDE